MAVAHAGCSSEGRVRGFATTASSGLSDGKAMAGKEGTMTRLSGEGHEVGTFGHGLGSSSTGRADTLRKGP